MTSGHFRESDGIRRVISMTFSGLLSQAARTYPEREFVRQGDQVLTYRAVHERSWSLAHALRGISATGRSQRVAVVANDRPEFLELIFGAARSGMVFVPVNRRLEAAGIARVFADCEPSVIVTDNLDLVGDAISRVPGLAVPLVSLSGTPQADYDFDQLVTSFAPSGIEQDMTGPGALYYTTGSTGHPKGAVRAESSHLGMALGAIARIPTANGDTWQWTLPFNSVALYGLGFQVIFEGARLTLPASLEPDLVLEDLVDRQVSHAFMSPTLWGRVLRRGLDRGIRPPSLRYAMWGGMPITQSLLDELDAWLNIPCTGVYGLTEAGCLALATQEEYRSGRPMASGRPICGMEFTVRDPVGKSLPTGVAGEILVRGTTVMEEYYRRPDETRRLLSDGWFATGDRGYLDTDGVLTVVDRIKDLIISGGENIAPAEVEGVIRTLDGVEDAAVIGLPDSEWGEVVSAFIVRKEDLLTEQQVIDQAGESLPSFMKPRRVFFVNEIPRNNMGKVARTKLRELGEQCRRADA